MKVFKYVRKKGKNRGMKEGEAGRKIVVYRWEEGKLWKVKTKGKKGRRKDFIYRWEEGKEE